MGCKIAFARDVSLTFYLIGLVLFVISFASPYWVETPAGHSGLWQDCVKQHDCFNELNFDLAVNYVRATQALMIIAMIGNGVAFAMYVVWRNFPGKQLEMVGSGIGLTAVTTGFLSGLFSGLGVSVYASQYVAGFYNTAGDLSWAWYSGLAGACVLTFNGLWSIVVLSYCVT